MVMNLFSVFDPVGLMGISLNWLSMFVVITVLPGIYFYGSGGLKTLNNNIGFILGNVFKEISFPNFLGMVIVSMGLFFMIGINNGFGLFPFVFTVTSHVIVTFSVGLVMWFSFFLMGWFKMFEHSSAHLVPEGSPVGLSPVMVMIESISHLIRPVTLSVRLAANMMAGHLIMGLIASISMVSFGGFLVSILLQSVLLLLEIAVAFIQAFVFSVLIMLYSLEYY